jgi:hypothetical protein
MTTSTPAPTPKYTAHASTDPLRYPVAYANVLKTFHKLGKTMSIQLQSTAEASTLKHRFYSYFRALRSTEGFEDLAAIAGSISLHQDGSILQLVPKESTWDAQAISKALEKIGPIPGLEPSAAAPVSPEARIALLQKLEELRAKNS